MNVPAIAVLLFGIGPYWSIAPDGSVIVVTPLEESPVVEIVIEEPPPVKTVSVKLGRHHPWPHGNCLMCLGNHVVQRHGHDKTYLDEIGSGQWGALHDRDHNTPGFRHGSKPRGTGYYPGTSRQVRWRPFWRFRR